MAVIRAKRGTRAQLNAAAASGLLLSGEPYLITDEGIIAIGTGASSYTECVKPGGALGTPASGALANCTFPTRNTLSLANIMGMGFSCTSTVITVESGQCVLESGSVAAYAGGTVTPGTLTAATFYHLYVYLSGGTATIELSTTAPAAPYLGAARSKAGASGYRYVGSVLTDSGGALYPQIYSAQTGENRYLAAHGTFVALNSGAQNSTFADVPLSAFIPTTAISVYFRGLRISGTGNVILSDSRSGVALDVLTSYASEKSLWLPCDDSQNISYYCGSGTTVSLYVLGYRAAR